ncbi:hypothetical protein OH492_14545 [Vibrio chagasii]|nr:hypothetical protein [Vibrio chagasii]
MFIIDMMFQRLICDYHQRMKGDDSNRTRALFYLATTDLTRDRQDRERERVNDAHHPCGNPFTKKDFCIEKLGLRPVEGRHLKTRLAHNCSLKPSLYHLTQRDKVWCGRNKMCHCSNSNMMLACIVMNDPRCRKSVGPG